MSLPVNVMFRLYSANSLLAQHLLRCLLPGNHLENTPDGLGVIAAVVLYLCWQAVERKNLGDGRFGLAENRGKITQAVVMNPAQPLNCLALSK